VPEPTIPGAFTPEQAADFMSIQQRIFFYGWCIDHRRFSDLDALFLPESVIHYDTPGGTKASWPEIQVWLANALQIFRATEHNMNNTMIAFEGADAATTTTYGHLIHFQEKRDGTINLFRHSGIYRDRWVRRDGLWRILERTLRNLGEDGAVYRGDEIVPYTSLEPVSWVEPNA
jgi:hypothetical protein